MRLIKYKLCTIVDIGAPDAPKEKEIFTEKTIACSEDVLEKNIAIAEEEAYNGAYEVIEATEAIQLDTINI